MTAKQLRAAAVLSLVCGVVGGSAFALTLQPRLPERPRVGKQIRAWLLGARYVGDEGVVLQRKRFDCGAAALKMVLAAHGIERDLGMLETELQTTGRGTSMLNMRAVAARAGLPARSWSLTADALRHAPLPAIAFIHDSHFVVIQKISAAGTLEIVDPALGRVAWPLSSFRKAWKGEVIVFNPLWQPVA